jgi:putative heme iron utilization protein
MASEADTTPGITIRRLMREASRAALGTLLAPTGEPYVSLAMVAVDHAAAPLLLLSDLADHTRNIAADPRVSLLFDGTAGMATPLAGARASVQGRAERVADERLRARYVARHADAAMYAGFKDFHLYRVAVERVHLVAGFGRIQWVPATEVLLDVAPAGALAAAEPEIVAHMNDDHSDAVQLCATRLLGQPADEWRLVGVDPEGVDMRCGVRRARLWFDRVVHDAAEARAELLRLVKRARAA